MESEHARFERLSETLKKEYEWFERVYSREIKRVLTASLEALMATEQKVPPPLPLPFALLSPAFSCFTFTKLSDGVQAMEAWEQFGPEAKAIA